MYAVIDGANIASRNALHDSLSRQLSLPEWYGRNLDALYDCLTDIREDSELVLQNTSELYANLGPYADVLQAVLRDACEENPHLRLSIDEGPLLP